MNKLYTLDTNPFHFHRFTQGRTSLCYGDPVGGGDNYKGERVTNFGTLKGFQIPQLNALNPQLTGSIVGQFQGKREGCPSSITIG